MESGVATSTIMLIGVSNTGWNKVVELDTNIDIWYWTKNSNKYATYADAGYKVINILGDYNYYAMTSNYFSESRSDFAYSYADQIYNYWNPYEYNIVTGSSRDYAEWNDSRVLGGAFGIWCDNPTLRTEEQIMDEALPLIRANAAKGWYPGANGLANYDTFTANWETYGDAPAGTTAAPEIYASPDLTALEAAVAEFETVDSTLYSAETYAAYTAAVDAGKALLTADKPTQAQADAALEAIQEAKKALAPASSGVECMLSAAFRSSKAYAGKSAILAVSVEKDAPVVAIELRDDRGNLITFTRQTKNCTRNDKDIFTLVFRVTKEDAGVRTYTAYAVLENGSRSDDCVTATLTVK